MKRAEDEPLLKPGMVVRLSSGGPDMTVCGPADDAPGWHCCVWYDEAQHSFKSINLPERALEIVPRD